MKRKKKTLKKVIIIFIIFLILGFIGYYIYNTYQNIEIGSNYKVEKTEYINNSLQTVENIEEKSQNIADILEETTKSVVGISKLKNNGNSIFTKSIY